MIDRAKCHRTATHRVSRFPTPKRTAIAASVALCTPLPANGQLFEAPIQGGSGGRYFEYSCGPGRMLVGLRGSAGVLVDAVQPVCARVDAAGHLTEARPDGPVFGGPRPLEKVADCPNQQAVRAIATKLNENEPLVGSIEITCQEVTRLDDGGQAFIKLEGGGHLDGYSSPILWDPSTTFGSAQPSHCPNNSYAIGIRGRSSQHLDALGLICAPKPTAAPLMADPVFANLVGQQALFQASNYIDRFIRHRHLLAYAEPLGDALGRQDATFRIVPGLAGRCISLESGNYPGQFLRHQNWRVKLAPREANDGYSQDATFCLVQGLAGSHGVSLESANAPGHFIRHRGGEIWVDRFDGSDLNRKDATFLLAQPGGLVR